jgi:hypothetical protein
MGQVALAWLVDRPTARTVKQLQDKLGIATCT